MLRLRLRCFSTTAAAALEKPLAFPPAGNAGSSETLADLSPAHTTLGTTMYPWKLSGEKRKEPGYGFFQLMKRKHLLNIGTSRMKGLLKGDDGPYAWPWQFQVDTNKVLLEAFATLSHPEQSLQLDRLRPLLIDGLAQTFVSSNARLRDQDVTATWSWTQAPKISVEGFYFTYGPFPPPPDYVGQDWIDQLTYVIPKEDAEFTSHPRQKEIIAQAAKAGCFVRVDTKVDWDVTFCLKTRSSNLPLLKDSRSSFSVSFMSPHFDPWDEIFVLQPDESWKLAWTWKLCDIDGVAFQLYDLAAEQS
ncbi:hypothetical protein HDV03_000562 [Kappamyces sp. JEL0829]|nr:hypothetical protein HDV03_000562 [Kappamyces sp. JEL0829]